MGISSGYWNAITGSLILCAVWSAIGDNAAVMNKVCPV